MTDKTKIATKYQKLTQIEHVLKRPGMYIGSVDEVDNLVYVLDGDKIIQKNIEYSPGLYKIFDEIIVNAFDQTIRDPTVTIIKVDINREKNEISIYNNGKGIDVVIHPKEKIYVPELIFGELLTSTSFDESKVRITGGIHGLGAKLTAIYSKYFNVDVGDPINKKKFNQTYKKNLSIKTKAKIQPYNKKEGYVKITFIPDLKYFKLDRLSDDLISLMERRVYDLSALSRKDVKVYLNNNLIDIKNLTNFVKMFTNNKIVNELCDPSMPEYIDDRWKIIVTSSSTDNTTIGNKFKQVSFVNGVYTSHGGKHVDYITNKIIKALSDKIQSKYKTSKIKNQFIKDQLWVFISAVIENPTFSSQTKEELDTPVKKFGSSCYLSKNFVKKVFEALNFDEIIKNQIKISQMLDLSKTDTKKKSKVKGIKKLYDANYAGTKKSKDCVLILTEGDSAKAMAISGLSAIPKSNNIYGVFPLKGKPLNVREASHKKIINNEEFKNIKKILGLTIGKHYTADNLSELRYGSVLLMMDADVDGSHIKGLFINMIDYYWPSLLKIEGFIKFFITPVVKVSKTGKKESISFYSLEKYKRWEKKNNLSRWNIKYYKGLGTNSSAEAKEYFKELDKHIINLKWDKLSDKSIKLAFMKDKAEERKVWLKDYDKDNILNYTQKLISYDDFIHKELIHFSNYDNIRSIPSLLDGLKPSQRKVLYSAFKKKLTIDIKVEQFIGYVSEQTAYHHGGISLAKTTIGMAQNFIGSNNVNLLTPSGQFGTRLLAGKDHSSPRYIFTKLEDITRNIFNKNDDYVLNYLEDDGRMIEPEYYMPIIPTVLVNGAEGIGTGYSTFIPKFNPLEIISIIEARINGKKFKEIKPWYNKFTGTIKKIGPNKYISKGVYKVDGNIVKILELPIAKWTEDFKIFLEEKISDNNAIASIKNNSNEEIVDFTIKFKDEGVIQNLIRQKYLGFDGLDKLFDLVTHINLNNMTLHDDTGQLKRYRGVTHILEDFYKIRLKYYQKRKDFLLKKLEDEIKIISSKVKFITLIVNKKINILGKPKDTIIKILEKNKLLKVSGEPPFDYLIRMSIYSLTKEKIDELKKLLNDKKVIYNNIKKTTIEDMWLNDLNNLRKLL